METVSNTYTPTNKYEEMASKYRSQMGDNPEAIKQAVAQEMSQNNPALQESISGQASNIEKMQKLAEADRQLASEFQKGTQGQQAFMTGVQQAGRQMGAVDTTSAQNVIAQGPAQLNLSDYTYQPTGLLSPFVSSGLSSGQQGAYSDYYNLADQQRGSLERAIGSEATAISNIALAQIKREEAQKAAEELKKQEEYKAAVNYSSVYGGTVTNPYTGEEEVYKSETERENEKRQASGEKIANPTATAWDNILANSKTEYDVWRQIDLNQDSLRAQGIDVDQLWAWHKNIVGRVGQGGSISTNAVLDQGQIDDLLQTRNRLVDQGLDTSQIDSQLSKSGYDVQKINQQTAEEKKELQDQQEVLNQYQSLKGVIKQLRDSTENTSLIGTFSGKGVLSGNNSRYSKLRNTAAVVIARAINNGAEPNKDQIAEAKKLIPSSTYGLQGNKNAMFDNILSQLKSAIGLSAYEQQLRSKLQSSGYDEQKINEYLATKGF